MNYVDVRKKKVFGPSVDVFPTLREGIDLRGAQETPRAAKEPLFSGRNQQQTRVQQIFGGNSVGPPTSKTGFLS